MGMEFEIGPDRLDLLGLPADQARQQMVGKQRNDRRAARADRVAVAGAETAFGIVHTHDHRFLADELLDRIEPRDPGFEIDQKNFREFNARHAARLPLQT